MPTRVSETLAGLAHQPREAWLLSRTYRMPLRDVARAMDCSSTATARHLQQAEEALAGALGDDVGEAARTLLDYSLTLVVPEFFRAGRRRREHLRRVVIAIALLASVFVMMWLARILEPRVSAP